MCAVILHDRLEIALINKTKRVTAMNFLTSFFSNISLQDKSNLQSLKTNEKDKVKKKPIMLPDDILFEIFFSFSNFNVREILGVATLSKYWKNRVSDKKNDERIWKIQCQLYWNINLKLSQELRNRHEKEFTSYKNATLFLRKVYLNTEFCENGIPSYIANLFGGIDNYLSIPVAEGEPQTDCQGRPNSREVEIIDHSPTTARLFSIDARTKIGISWGNMGKSVQNKAICRITTQGNNFIAFRLVHNYFSYQLNGELKLETTEEMVFIHSIPGRLRHERNEKLVLNQTMNQGYEIDPVRPGEVGLKSLEWIKKIISGQPCGRQFLGKEGNAFIKNGLPTFILWKEEKPEQATKSTSALAKSVSIKPKDSDPKKTEGFFSFFGKKKS